MRRRSVRPNQRDTAGQRADLHVHQTRGSGHDRPPVLHGARLSHGHDGVEAVAGTAQLYDNFYAGAFLGPKGALNAGVQGRISMMRDAD